MLDNFLYGTHVSQKSHASRKPRQFLVGGVLLSVLTLAFQVLNPSLLPRAEAGASWLCSGFSSCASKGLSNHGYKSVWYKMFWQMYPYRNCVNYVAFKVIQDGGPETRPWSGSGNATNWGYAMRQWRNDTPSHGAVAWWRAGDSVGSYGHVAYVEKVVSSREIIVSESNYGSDFSYRRLTKGANWPTGFIHVPDRSIDNVVRPQLTGTPVIGGRLRVSGGKWDPVSKPTYRWYADGQHITGKWGRSLAITRDLLGKRISARVTATKSGYESGRVMTEPSAPVADSVLRNTVRPHLVGSTMIGNRIRIVGGKWSPVANPSYTWYADGRRIKGAQGKRSLYMAHWLKGSRITARVTATRKGYASASVTTPPSSPVHAGTIRNLVRPRLVGSMKVGSRVYIQGGKWSPSATPSYTWYIGGKVVKVAHKRSMYVPEWFVGRTITARVTATKPGLHSASVLTAGRKARR